MKQIVSASVFSLVSAWATANPAALVPERTAATTTAAAATETTPAPTAQAGATSYSQSESSSAKVLLRVQLDPFYKNLNQATKNYKTPKLDTFRVMFERNLGQYSKVDAELRLHELENGKKYGYNEASKKTSVNTDLLKYYHLLFKIPGAEGLEVGYVRELEPALYGITDKVKSSNVAESVSFTGHISRIEGYRAIYDTGVSDLKLTYHLARLGSLDDKSYADLNDKESKKAYSKTTWYHKFTTDLKIDKTPVQLGVGTQGKWLDINEQSKLKYDLFIHLLAEHKVDDVKLKAGVAYDTYATTKKSDGSAGKNVATTYLAAAKYDLLPKEFALLTELNFRTLKRANSLEDNFSSTDPSQTDSANEAAFTLAGQYMLDDKLSFIPSYTYYNSNRSQAWVDNANGKAFEEREALVGANNKPAKVEQALGLRIRYDY